VRNLLLLALIYGSLPVILARPFFGLLVYGWLSYLRPQDMTWGSAREQPLAAVVAIAIFAGLALALGRERPLTWRLPTALLILLAGWISVTVYTAVEPELSGVVYGHYWKGILIAVLMTGMVRIERRARLLLVLLACCLGLLGAKFGLFGLLRGGTRFDNGPGGMMLDNNSFAVGLNMALPLLVGVFLAERWKWLRIAALAMALLSILTIFFTFSRGGLLTLMVVGSLLIWRTRNKALAAAVVALGVAGFLVLSSDQVVESYFGRAETIADYSEDGSAQGRLMAWRASWAVFLDHPVFGVGPDNFQAVFDRYAPGADRFRVSHNSYLQLLAECGLPALALFLGLLLVTLWRLERVRRRAGAPWVEIYARALQVSILAYMTGSLFLNLAYFELIYGLLGASAGLEIAAENAGSLEPSQRAAWRRGAEIPWWKQPRPVAVAVEGAGGGGGAAVARGSRG
jgi:probable O-glycosylation ligase (exosortase A-associated)